MSTILNVWVQVDKDEKQEDGSVLTQVELDDDTLADLAVAIHRVQSQYQATEKRVEGIKNDTVRRVNQWEANEFSKTLMMQLKACKNNLHVLNVISKFIESSFYIREG